MKELYKALAKFQSEIKPVKKDGNNPHFKSKYATLDSILESIREPLANSGLVVCQYVEGHSELITKVIHAESGECIESKIALMVDANKMQAFGSAITYARRYALSPMLGISTEEDDDGNKANEAPKKELPWLNENTEAWQGAITHMSNATDKQSALNSILKKYRLSQANKEKLLSA